MPLHLVAIVFTLVSARGRGDRMLRPRSYPDVINSFFFRPECFKLYEDSLREQKTQPTKNTPCPICNLNVEKFIPLYLNAEAYEKKLEKIIAKKKIKLESKIASIKKLEENLVKFEEVIEHYKEDLRKANKTIDGQRLQIGSNNILMKKFDRNLYETKKSTEDFQNDLVNSRKITKNVKSDLVEAKRRTSYAEYVTNELERKVAFLEEKVKHSRREISLCEREKKQQGLAHLNAETSLVEQIRDLNYALVEKTNILAQRNVSPTRVDRTFGRRQQQKMENTKYDHRNSHIGHCASIEMFTSM